MRAQIPTSSDEQLSVPQFRILLKLAKESSTHKALAEWMGVAAPTLTRMVDTLVERKLVERVVDSNDRLLKRNSSREKPLRSLPTQSPRTPHRQN